MKKKTTLLLCYLCLLFIEGFGQQPTHLQTNIIDGSTFDNTSLDLWPLFNLRQVRLQTANASTGATWVFYNGPTLWSPKTSNQFIPSFNQIIDTNQVYSAKVNGLHPGKLPATSASSWYTFNVEALANKSVRFAILETTNQPTNINSLSIDNVTIKGKVTAALSNILASGEKCYVRYGPDTLLTTSNILPMSSAGGNNYSAILPQTCLNDKIWYYVFTSNKDSAFIAAQATLFGSIAYPLLSLNQKTTSNGGTLNYSENRNLPPIVVSSTICQGSTAIASYTPVNFTGVWSSSNNSIFTVSPATGTTATLTPNNLGSANIILKATAGCANSITASVTVNAKPGAVSVTPNSKTQCTDSPAQIVNASGGTGSFVWSPITGLFTDALATIAYTGGNAATVYAKPGVTTKYTATSTNVSNCSSIDTSNIVVNCTLPVGLLSFTGAKENGASVLRWRTTTEQNNKGFSIERSADGRNFSSIGFVNSKADNGNSNREIGYSYADDKINSVVYFYRLKQTDFDNRTTLSHTIVIKGEIVPTIKLSRLYPNPATEQVTITIDSPGDEKVILEVSDMYGRKLILKNVVVEKGTNSTNINVSGFASGTYFIKLISTKSNDASVLKFKKISKPE